MNTRRAAVTLSVVAVLALAGCSGGQEAAKQTANAASSPTVTTTETATSPPTARAIADRIKSAVPSVVRIVQLTEHNDPNNLIGRPGGYIDAVVLYDKRVHCTELGADCGTTIEIWPSDTAATDRATYIQGILGGGSMLGTEYDYVDGTALLRVTGVLPPSAAKIYASAFGGMPVTPER